MIRRGTLLRRLGEGPDAIEVHDDGELRWLRFGYGAIQSRVDLDEPLSLPLPYTLGMVAPLLFRDRFDSVLMLGLGGGSMLRFYHRFMEEARFEVVDSSALMPRVARTYFDAPIDDPRVSTRIADARTAVKRDRGRHDLLMVDVFNADGLPGWMAGGEFHADCRASLRSGGIAVVNLWVDARDELLTVVDGLRDAYEGELLLLTPPASQNLVVLCFDTPPGDVSIEALQRRASELRELSGGLDTPALVDRLREANRVDGDRLMT